MEKVILMLEQYISVITGGRKDIKVEIIDDTIVLSRDEMWYIYIIPERYTMIGCFIDQDIDLSNLLRKEALNIYHIYEQVKSDEEF